MKFKTTKKAIKESYSKIYSVGYCNMANLLKYRSPIAYSAGVYGWACDYYLIDGIVISTGYNPIGETLNYKLIDKYESKAEGIIYDLPFGSDEKRLLIESLLLELLKEAQNE